MLWVLKGTISMKGFLAHKTGVKIEGMWEYYNFDAKGKKMGKKNMFWVLRRDDSAS